MDASMAADAGAGLFWLTGGDGAAGLTRALSDWPLLPHAGEGGDRAEHAAAYLAELRRWTEPAAGGLVLASGACESGLWLAGIRRLEWDSRFFGFGVGRLEPLLAPVAPRVLRSTVAAGAELIGRCIGHARAAGLRRLSSSVATPDTQAQLSLQQAGFLLMDTIAGYQLRLSEVPPSAVPGEIRPGRPEDVEPLADVCTTCFSDRSLSVNRFNSDPTLPCDSAGRLYAAWLRNCFVGGAADQVLVAEVGGRPAGFISIKLPPTAGPSAAARVGRIPLNAVHPSFQRRGIYGRLVRAAVEWSRGMGVGVLEIRTQLTCASVHRTWQKLGARMAFTCHTFHHELPPAPAPTPSATGSQ